MYVVRDAKFGGVRNGLDGAGQPELSGQRGRGLEAGGVGTAREGMCDDDEISREFRKRYSSEHNLRVASPSAKIAYAIVRETPTPCAMP